MRLLVAPQEFKGSLSAVEAAQAIGDGARAARPDVDLDLAPLADGGPGTVEAVITAADGRYTTSRVDGPLGAPVPARWGRIDDGATAVIEMAAASGLSLLPAAQLDPRCAATHGTGELICAALDARCRRILVGVGGSATTDGGAGMAAALGVRFLDDQDRPLPPGGAALARLARIDRSGLDARLPDTALIVLADVSNPLLGPTGASAIYGPQKGADRAAVAELERALTHYADIVARDLGLAIGSLPGGGAAGGLAAGLVAFCGATIVPGFARVAEAIGLAGRIHQADAVITGEGRLDRQSAWGKTVGGVAGMAAAAGRPCFAVAGAVADIEAVRALPGLTGFEVATPNGTPPEEAAARAPALVAAAAERLVRRRLGGA